MTRYIRFFDEIGAQDLLLVGGILSHGAIVAREYGIPAVMGVRGITAALSTGQIVQVDGNRGRVQVVVTG
jgi:pyruvate,water dikinase